MNSSTSLSRSARSGTGTASPGAGPLSIAGLVFAFIVVVIDIIDIVAFDEGAAGAGIDTAGTIHGRGTVDRLGHDRWGTCCAPTTGPQSGR